MEKTTLHSSHELDAAAGIVFGTLFGLLLLTAVALVLLGFIEIVTG
jgi:hypothetical protein